jgi:hypothetical protein
VIPGTVVFRDLAPYDGTAVEVLRADPVIDVVDQIMDMAKAGDLPAVTVTTHGSMELFTITARNGTWIYVVGPYDPGRATYRCHWPD